jgi:hypothetical protein
MQALFYLMLRLQLRTEIPSLKYFDIYGGEFEIADDGNFMPGKRPCVFVEFGSDNPQMRGQKTAGVAQPFALYVVTDTVKPSSNETANDINAAREIKAHGALVQEVKKALINFRGGLNIGTTQALYNSGIILAPGGRPITKRGNHYFTQINFNVTLTDYAAVDITTTTITDFDVIVDVEA